MGKKRTFFIKARKERGWTQQQLGEWIGVTKQAISNFETCKQGLSLHNAIKLTYLLDLELEEVFFSEPVRQQSTAEG